MRICLYTGTALPKLGGQEAVVDALARHLLEQGHEPVVLAPRPRLPLRPQDSDLPYPVVRHPRFYSTQYFVSWYRTWLLSAHRRYRFDVVHCHDVYPTGYLAALTREKLKIPIVITSHGGDIRAGNLRLSKSALQPRFHLAVKEADALVSIGRFTQEAFLRLGADPQKIIHIPNGVDLRPFAQAAPRPAEMEPSIIAGKYLLFLGRLAIRKGVDTLLQAWSQVKTDGANADVQLVIAGSGEEKGLIEQQIHNLNLQQRVKMVGRVGGAKKTYLLQNALCTVIPSRGWEAFPLVLLESYAAGCPVLATAIPGLEDLVQNHITGLLVPPESPTELAAAIARTLADPSWRNRAGETARTTATNYGWDQIAARHAALYLGLI